MMWERSGAAKAEADAFEGGGQRDEGRGRCTIRHTQSSICSEECVGESCDECPFIRNARACGAAARAGRAMHGGLRGGQSGLDGTSHPMNIH
jgi:hypothetical protein